MKSKERIAKRGGELGKRKVRKRESKMKEEKKGVGRAGEERQGVKDYIDGMRKVRKRGIAGGGERDEDEQEERG